MFIFVTIKGILLTLQAKALKTRFVNSHYFYDIEFNIHEKYVKFIFFDPVISSIAPQEFISFNATIPTGESNLSEQAVTVRDVFTDELKTSLKNGTVLLIDVREPHEFDAGHIPGAILMPLSIFEACDLPKPESKRIIFSCRTGVRSIQALRLAQQAGLKITEHYKPGFVGWVNDGGEITKVD